MPLTPAARGRKLEPMLGGAMLFFVAAFLVAAVTRSSVAVALAAVVWPLYYAGLLAGARGSGVHAWWPLGVCILTAVTGGGAVLGLAVGRATLGPPRPWRGGGGRPLPGVGGGPRRDQR